MRAGLYDESLSALRTAGEVVNLLTLLEADPDLLKRWQKATATERYTLARPTRVIEALAAAGRGASSLDAEKYDVLSRIAHGNTNDAPQSYNALGAPLTAGRFQEAGFLAVLNEAALATALAVLPGVALVPIERDVKLLLLREARALVEHTGAVTATRVREALEGMRAKFLTALYEQLQRDEPQTEP